MPIMTMLWYTVPSLVLIKLSDCTRHRKDGFRSAIVSTDGIVVSVSINSLTNVQITVLSACSANSVRIKPLSGFLNMVLVLVKGTLIALRSCHVNHTVIGRGMDDPIGHKGYSNLFT